jgi:hypothetical protein
MGIDDAAVIDVHAHVRLHATNGAAGRYGPEFGTDESGKPWYRVGNYKLVGVKHTGSPFTDPELRLAKMREAHIDFQVLSPSPLTYFHHIELPVALALTSAAVSDVGWESLAVRLPWSSTVAPGAWDADRAATASAATAVVAAPLRSLLPMYAAIQRTPPAGDKSPCSACFRPVTVDLDQNRPLSVTLTNRPFRPITRLVGALRLRCASVFGHAPQQADPGDPTTTCVARTPVRARYSPIGQL